MIKIGAQKNHPKFYPQPLYVGFVTVLTDKGLYLYRKYCNPTRLTRQDALQDARLLEFDMLSGYI